MITSFSSLDFSRQLLVARFVVETYKEDFNRNVSIDEVVRLFNGYDVQVEWAEDESFEVLVNDRLEQAMKSIISKF